MLWMKQKTALNFNHQKILMSLLS
ncbi:uncharacterized protein METZ01_LOCUS108258 [marine metagenome]|uniref:Uncharacterized protein n=1 Tax=marine metagenome TaxID=408172 RepID=A0A381WSD0_9ZZZZ